MTDTKPKYQPKPKTIKAVILCPGPSLTDKVDVVDADIVIGVNRAPVILGDVKFGWWAFMDFAIYEDHKPAKVPAIITTNTCVRTLEKKGFEMARHKVEVTDKMGDDQYPHVLGWRIYTTPIAIMQAYKLGAKSIELQGVDMVDAPDADGVLPKGAKRDESRWTREREIIDGMTKWLKSKGVALGIA